MTQLMEIGFQTCQWDKLCELVASRECVEAIVFPDHMTWPAKNFGPCSLPGQVTFQEKLWTLYTCDRNVIMEDIKGSLSLQQSIFQLLHDYLLVSKADLNISNWDWALQALKIFNMNEWIQLKTCVFSMKLFRSDDWLSKTILKSPCQPQVTVIVSILLLSAGSLGSQSHLWNN